METRYLKTLTAVVDCGSFSKAAEVLHITQSAVSQRIKFLEEHFGQQLLDRNGPKLTLTATGRTVLLKAREILDMEQELLNALQDSEERKHLALCCTPTFGMAFLPQVLNDFIRCHADMNDLKFIFMQPLQALQGLRNGEYQLAVVEHPPEYDFKGLRRYALPDDEMLFVISPLHNIVPLEGNLVTDLQMLFPQRLFARRDGCSSKEVLRQNLKAVGADFDSFSGLVISDDLRLTIQSVLVGTGVAYLSRDLVADYLQSGQMIALKVQGF
ncbi:MAG: LysR family transcriptional regulator, partial [Desulfuromonas sp.]